MFGKLMNRYYYGKSGKGDYTTEDLPQTRWALFWEMLRVRFSALFRLNLMYMVAWLPAIFVIGRGLMMAYSGLANVSEMQLQVEAGELAAEVLAENNALLGDALNERKNFIAENGAIAVTGPFTAGISYVTRNWARDEHAFIWSDYWDAVKGNWKQGLITSVITGFVPLLMYVCVSFYGEMASNSNPLFIIPQMLVLVMSVLWLCSLMYIYPQMVTYSINYKGLVRNSLIMVVGRLPMTVGLKLLSLVPTLIAAVVALLTPYAIYAAMVLAAYYILLGYALSRFIYASYANAVFDRYININIEGAQIGRGLYVETDEDNEEDAEKLEDPSAPEA